MGTPCGTWLKPGRSIAECLKLSGKTRHLRSVRLEKCGEHLSQTAEGWMWLLDAIPSMTKKRKREEGKKRVEWGEGRGRKGGQSRAHCAAHTCNSCAPEAET